MGRFASEKLNYGARFYEVSFEQTATREVLFTLINQPNGGFQVWCLAGHLQYGQTANVVPGGLRKTEPTIQFQGAAQPETSGLFELRFAAVEHLSHENLTIVVQSVAQNSSGERLPGRRL